MTHFAFLLLVLAVYRVCFFVARENGPLHCMVKLRKRVGNGFLGELMDCPYCLSVWFSFLAVAGVGEWEHYALYSIAVSGATVLLFQLMDK